MLTGKNGHAFHHTSSSWDCDIHSNFRIVCCLADSQLQSLSLFHAQLPLLSMDNRWCVLMSLSRWNTPPQLWLSGKTSSDMALSRENSKTACNKNDCLLKSILRISRSWTLICGWESGFQTFICAWCRHQGKTQRKVVIKWNTQNCKRIVSAESNC